LLALLIAVFGLAKIWWEIKKLRQENGKLRQESAKLNVEISAFQQKLPLEIAKLSAETEKTSSELEQTHLKEVLEGRMKAYPRLWRILQAQVSNWRMEGKHANGEWAVKLYADLNACHANYGVFFSQPVYEAFCEVREAVRKLAVSYGPEQEVPADAVMELDVIWSGRGKPGMATQLKDDLGSYRPSIISARRVRGQ